MPKLLTGIAAGLITWAVTYKYYNFDVMPVECSNNRSEPGGFRLIKNSYDYIYSDNMKYQVPHIYVKDFYEFLNRNRDCCEVRYNKDKNTWEVTIRRLDDGTPAVFIYTSCGDLIEKRNV